MLYRLKIKKQGFTLVEILVSMSIIVILTTVFIANFRLAGRQGELSAAAQQLVSDIRRAQSHALGLKEYDFGSGPEVPLGGWGIHFSKLTGSNENEYYIIFPDETGNHFRNANEEYETIFFGNGIYISDTLIETNSRDNMHLSFFPPDLNVWICRNAAQCSVTSEGTNGSIILSNGSDTKTIYVNQFGLVDIIE